MAKKEPVDKGTKKKADEKVSKSGWLRAAMMFEVLAIREDAARNAMEKHVDALSKEKWVMAYKKDIGKPDRIENPLPNKPQLKEAYSCVSEVECVVQRYEDLISIVMHYGPSSIEILEPNNLTLDLGEAQGILNSVADLVHKFVAAGIGGIVVKT
ncbi:MAG: hypothetical protein DRO99_04000 [Candidatus Aenigmatarchaeota archaeon]|nr:MAG: hypothetical protein DRO99_04000 [Candidatus Aenigmarchaeota archaeon]